MTSAPFAPFASPIGTQLGPDGKIYTSFGNGNALGVIDFPNQPQAGWILNAVPLFPGIHSGFGLVNVPGNSLHDPTPQISGVNTICSGLQTTYNLAYDPCGTNGILWEYLGSGSLVSSTDSTATIQFGAGGMDTLIATKLADCSSLSDTLLITVGTGTPVNIGPDQYLCAGSIQLDAGSGYTQYTWSNGGSNQTTTVTGPGWYWVDVLDQAGCIERDSIYLYANPGPPMPNLGPDTTICGGNIILLDPGTEFVSYLWQDNTTDTVHTVYQAGTYTVEVEGPCGEFGRDTVEILPCVGLDGEEMSVHISIFPNPNEGAFRVEAEFGEWIDGVELKVVDVLGREVWSEKRLVYGGQLQEDIRLGQLAKGTYLLRISHGTGDFAQPFVIW